MGGIIGPTVPPPFAAFLHAGPRPRPWHRVRRRVRARGGGGKAYGNCPKYIQACTAPAPALGESGEARGVAPADDSAESITLSDAQHAWLRAAHTAFVASVGPSGRADASHRSGAPGFLAVVDARRLVLPDYAGNTIFSALGNLAADPRVRLVVPDFDGGRLLQLTGTAAVN